MGLYDRDYSREEPKGFFLGGDRSMVVNLIIVNVAVFLADVLIFHGELSSWMAIQSDLLEKPWNCWQLLTAGFAHDPVNPFHVGCNMFALWLFGTDVETIYGKKEFLRIYLTMMILSTLVWAVVVSAGERGTSSMLGASGAVNGVMMLFVLHYPHRQFLVWGVLPVPAWLLCTIEIGQDVMGYDRSVRGVNDGIAHEAHLAGAAFAFLYYKTGWNLGRWLPSFSFKSLKRRLKPGPKLRIHSPASREQDLTQEVDRILEKISAQGESSLSAAERRTLEEASRRYQQKRR